MNQRGRDKRAKKPKTTHLRITELLLEIIQWQLPMESSIESCSRFCWNRFGCSRFNPFRYVKGAEGDGK